MKVTVKKLVNRVNFNSISMSSSFLLFLEKLSNHDEKESCALVFGDHSNDDAIVKDIVPMNEKAERSVVHFSMDPLAAFKEIESAEQKGLKLIAIFHSHPGQGIPAPSGTDRTYMKYWPVVWLISNKGVGQAFVVRGFLLNDDGNTIKEVPVIIKN